MSRIDAPIGVFDSGVEGCPCGARSCAYCLTRTLSMSLTAPTGHTAHDRHEICQLSEAVASFLTGQGCKILAVALQHLRAAFDVSIADMVPAVKPAARQTHTCPVCVLVTGVTLLQ